jgi:hypothetical protein
VAKCPNILWIVKKNPENPGNPEDPRDGQMVRY